MSDTIWVVRNRGGAMCAASDDPGAAVVETFGMTPSNRIRPIRDALARYASDAVEGDANGYTLRRITLPTDAERALVGLARAWWESLRPLSWTEAEHIATPAVNCTSDWECALARGIAVLAERAATTRVSVASSASVQSGGKWVPIPDMGPTRNNATWQATAENDGTERAATSPGDAPRATGA